MAALESQLLNSIPGVFHSFGTADEPVSKKWLSEWESTKPTWKQVHGTACAHVTSPLQNCGEVDSLWTDLPEQWVGVATADCVPILIADKTGRAVAAVHAGWRGTLAKAVKPVLLAMGRAGYSGSDLIAAIGPSIGACCFEVGENVVEQFLTEFPQISEEALIPKPLHLDLAVVNEALLRGFGIEQIETLHSCTKCSRDHEGKPLFQSFRRDGGTVRQWSIISRKSR